MNNTGRKTVKGTSTSAPMVAKSTRSATASAKTSTGSAGLASASSPTHEQIAIRSFEIYLSRGATPGHELDDWYQALRDLQSN